MAPKTSKSKKKNPDEIFCTIKEIPASEIALASQEAISINPNNAPPNSEVLRSKMDKISSDLDLNKEDSQWLSDEVISNPAFLAVLNTKYWGSEGVRLTVSFMESVTAKLKEKILAYANKWGQHGNVKFSLTNNEPGQIRISLRGSGYWSYLGTDILRIPKDQPTMNLQGFSINTSDDEYNRVVVHEFGHSLGFPHEHLRTELIELIDRDAAIALFKRTNGWSAATTISNVLTPLDPRTITGSSVVDQDSVMAYYLPASITKNGQPIRGGKIISSVDAKFVSQIYPLQVAPPPISTGETRITLLVTGDVKSVKILGG